MTCVAVVCALWCLDAFFPTSLIWWALIVNASTFAIAARKDREGARTRLTCDIDSLGPSRKPSGSRLSILAPTLAGQGAERMALSIAAGIRRGVAAPAVRKRSSPSDLPVTDEIADEIELVEETSPFESAPGTTSSVGMTMKPVGHVVTLDAVPVPTTDARGLVKASGVRLP